MTHRITISIPNQQYNELTYVGRSLGMNDAEISRLAIGTFLLSLKHSTLKLYLNDAHKLDQETQEAFKQLYPDIELQKVQ
jgi:hypothetical protein